MTQKEKSAGNTAATVGKSKQELEQVLQRYGVQHFAYASQPGAIAIAFQHSGDKYRIVLPMLTADTPDLATTEAGKRRTAAAVQQLLDKAERQRWRALLLKVKADLELAHLTGQPIRTAFAAHLVLHNDETVTERLETDRGAPPPLPWLD